MSVEIREVSGFDKVRFKGPGTVKITQTDDAESLTVHAPAYVIADIESVVRDGVLHLGYVSPKVFSLRVIREVISYDLKIKDLERLGLSGSGRIVVPDLDVDQLAIDLSGSGKIIMEKLTADRLDVFVTGSGNINLEGDVEVQNVKISGSGIYDALRLVSDFCSVSIPGSGVASVLVNDEMDVRIDGSGQVNYKGYPEIRKRVSGSGRIRRIRKALDTSNQNPTGEDHG